MRRTSTARTGSWGRTYVRWTPGPRARDFTLHSSRLLAHTHIHIHASARPFIVRGLETARFHDYGLDRCGGEPPMNRHHGMVGIGHNEVYVAGDLDV